MKIEHGSVRIGPLDPRHDRRAFACGNAILDRYLREQASQDLRRGVARVFVATSIDAPSRIMGFFTLSAASVVATDLPAEVAKRLPRHPIPAALVGRLAVDLGFTRRGLGGIMLADAVKRTMAAAETVAMTVLVVDPIDETARAFYAAFGFRDLQGPEQRMFLPLVRGAHPA